MEGREFVEVLEEFGVRIGAATKSQWKRRDDISKTVVRNALEAFQSQLLAKAIVPLTEFHAFDLDHGKNLDTFAKRLNNKDVEKKLRDTRGGIYAFYDTVGALLYVGKTESNLFTEMEQRYWAKKIGFRVINKKGRASRNSWPICDHAQFVSAYSVAKGLITNVEALATRLLINRASNIRVESFNKIP